MKATLALIGVLVACGPGGRGPDQTAIDAQPHDAAPMICFQPSVTGMAMHGTPNIQACAIWNDVANMSGQVTLSRTGDTITLAFATGITFTGPINGTHVTLTYAALHDFEDGCTWRATETLTGTIDPVTCVMMLAYDYEEMVAVSNGACATPCTGTADFALQISPIIE